MHVAVDVRTIQASYAGDRIYLESLLRHLVRLEEISAVSLYTEPRLGDSVPLPRGEKLRTQPVHASRGWLWTPVAVPRQLRRDGVDVFHAPHLVPLSAPCPTVATIHDTTLLLLAGRGRWRPRAALDHLLREVCARRAGAVITDSENSRRDLQRLMHVPAGRIHVIPLAAAEHFTPGDREQARARVVELLGVQGPYVLCVGWAGAHKNVPAVLRAVAALRLAGTAEASVVVVGRSGADTPGSLHERFPGLAGRLHFTGWIGTEDLVAVYRGAALLAFPSLYEGFGLPVLEAMACGTPVVTANTSALPEVAGEAALLVDPTDEAALAEAIGQVLTDDALAALLSERGRQRAAQFSWDRTARQTVEVYRGLVR